MAHLAASAEACSVLYYYDDESGTAYVANNEDYWYDQRVTLRIQPAKKDRYAHLWYGWKDFAQGGVNEHGLFFDGAVTPEAVIPDDYGPPKGNLGERILATCKAVEDVLELLEREKVALTNAHMMIGDATGAAVVIEWVEGQQELIEVDDNHLIMTNHHLSKTENDGFVCPRYESIANRIEGYKNDGRDVNLLTVGNFLGSAAQMPRPDESGRLGGTLYSTFINLKELEFVFVPKLDSSKAKKFDLREEFQSSRAKTLRFK